MNTVKKRRAEFIKIWNKLTAAERAMVRAQNKVLRLTNEMNEAYFKVRAAEEAAR